MAGGRKKTCASVFVKSKKNMNLNLELGLDGPPRSQWIPRGIPGLFFSFILHRCSSASAAAVARARQPAAVELPRARMT
jgi:hypothetical protein